MPVTSRRVIDVFQRWNAQDRVNVLPSQSVLSARSGNGSGAGSAVVRLTPLCEGYRSGLCSAV